MRSLILVLALAAVQLPAAALAEGSPQAATAPATTRLKGTVVSLEGSRLTIKADDGVDVALMLTTDTIVTNQVKAAFSDIKSGDFVASAAVEQADGKTHAQELRIFPESMRGLGEGHRPMGMPHQTMTNATVKKVAPVAHSSMTNATVTKISGGVLTTEYPGGSTDIVIDPDTPVWRIVPAQPSALTPGTAMRAFADKATDGTLTAKYISVQ